MDLALVEREEHRALDGLVEQLIVLVRDGCATDQS